MLHVYRRAAAVPGIKPVFKSKKQRQMALFFLSRNIIISSSKQLHEVVTNLILQIGKLKPLKMN